MLIANLTEFFAQVHRAAACDAALLRRYPKLAWSALGAVVVPALYALIVLSSVWDSNARTSQLPVALVNQDTGLRYGIRDVNLGAEVFQAMRADGLFGYRDFNDADTARRAVREGQFAFAVLLPPDFSRRALLGSESGAGHLILYLSEGNNYAASGFAKRFAPELAHRVNETLNESRWALVLESTAGSKRDLNSLRQAVDALVEGANKSAAAAHQVRQGSQTLAAGTAEASDAGQRLQGATAPLAVEASKLGLGLRQLGSGLRAVDSKDLLERDVQALRQGGSALQRGHTELGAGLQQLQAGADSLRDGVSSFKLEAGNWWFIGTEFAQAAGALQSGAEQLELGLGTARAAQGRLVDGTQRFVDGSNQLADGLLRQSAAIGQLVSGLPDDASIESFAAGAAEVSAATSTLAGGLHQLRDGQTQLHQGQVRLEAGSAELATHLRQLQASLPAGKAAPEGTAAGLAQSVQPVLEMVAQVPNEGAGFAPNFVPLALWMGAVMTAFLFHFRQLPIDLMAAPRAATVAGRLFFPALLTAGQSLVMLAILVGLLQMQTQRLLPVAVTLLSASLLFLCLIFALVHLFGDVGKMVAVLLLVVQMSSAGVLLPIELTPPLFQAMHRWLPLSWVVHAFRASMFGAYEGAWVSDWVAMLFTGSAALAVAVIFGRWRPVKASAYRASLEVERRAADCALTADPAAGARQRAQDGERLAAPAGQGLPRRDATD
jgi:putative membrane protein